MTHYDREVMEIHYKCPRGDSLNIVISKLMLASTLAV